MHLFIYLFKSPQPFKRIYELMINLVANLNGSIIIKFLDELITFWGHEIRSLLFANIQIILSKPEYMFGI